MDETGKGRTERRHVTLSEEDFERLAHRTSEIVMDQVALLVGKGVLKMTVYIITVAAIAAWSFVNIHEKLPK